MKPFPERRLRKALILTGAFFVFVWTAMIVWTFPIDSSRNLVRALEVVLNHRGPTAEQTAVNSLDYLRSHTRNQDEFKTYAITADGPNIIRVQTLMYYSSRTRPMINRFNITGESGCPTIVLDQSTVPHAHILNYAMSLEPCIAPAPSYLKMAITMSIIVIVVIILTTIIMWYGRFW
jgi:hypothetical protein